MSNLRMYIPLTKVDAANRLVYGIATGETVDRSGEVCDYASTKPFYETWSGDIAKASGGKSLGNLRAMHGKVAAGKVTAITFNDAAKQIEICAKVVDDAEWGKVLEGVYTGFSQGGGYEKRWKDADGLQRYTANPSEVSLVDLPCLPTATFDMIKAAGVVEVKHFADAVQVKADPTNADVATKAGELAKAAGQGDWIAFIEPARAELVKAALPAPEPLPGGEPEPAAAVSTPAAPSDDLKQMWVTKDGSPFAKKADAVAHNAVLDAANQPSTKAVLDAIGAIGDHLGIAKASTDPMTGVGAKVPNEGKDQATGGGAAALNATLMKPPRMAPTGEAMKAATADDLRKNLYRVSRLAELLASLKSIQESSEVDVLYGYATPQDPAIGAAMKAWLANGCELLITIVQHEADSLVGDVDDDMMMAAGSKLTAGHVAVLGKAAAHVPALATVLAKVGRRNSKADADTIQAMHDHAATLGATCDAGNCDGDAGKAAGGDLAKALATMTSDRDLAKARGDALQRTMDDTILPMLKTIGERVANIERQPMPLPLQRGVTRAVSKGADDAASDDIAATLIKMRTDDPNAYALLMIKAAQQDPQAYQHAR